MSRKHDKVARLRNRTRPQRHIPTRMERTAGYGVTLIAELLVRTKMAGIGVVLSLALLGLAATLLVGACALFIVVTRIAK